MNGFRNLSADEIVAQVKFIVDRNTSYNPLDSKEFKINYTRMGEPFLNIENVKTAIKLISELYPNTHHYISTIGLNGADFNWIKDNITLQLSLHSLDEERRNWLIPYRNKMTIAELGRVRTKSNLKTTLNLTLVDEEDFDIEKIKKNFDKIKINYQDIESEMAKIICYKEKREYKFEILINRKTDIKNLKKVFTSGKLEISKKTTNNIKNPRINYKFITDIQLYYKIFGKTAINLLAYSKGKEFVEHKDFENLKNKIFGKDSINLSKDINFLENKIDLKEIIFKAINDPFISISSKNIEKFNENYVNEGTCSSIIIQDNKSNIEAVFSVLGISFYILLIENSEIKIGNPIFYLINSKTRKELFSKNFAEELITYLK